MSDQNSDAILVLVNSMKKIANNLIEHASFDKTVPGVITRALNSYKYKVKIKNEEYIIPSATDQTYKVNEAVWVCIPQNNMKNKFISGRRRS